MNLQSFLANGLAAQKAVDALTAPTVEAKQRETVNATPLLCRSAVREFLLEAGKQHRPFNKFSRVSEDTLIVANAMLRQWCVSRVKSAPSKGVTL